MKQPGWSGGLGRINTETGGVRDLTEVTRDRTERRKEKEAEERECRKDSDPENRGSWKNKKAETGV